MVSDVEIKFVLTYRNAVVLAMILVAQLKPVIAHPDALKYFVSQLQNLHNGLITGVA
jgi:hypothetical protein